MIKFYSGFFLSLPLIFLFSCHSEKSINIDLSELKWMTGSWMIDNGDSSLTYEKWIFQNENLMEGTGITIDNSGDTSFFEVMKIERIKGKISMNISVDKTDAVLFLLTYYSGKEARFENPEHDFPQKIIYLSENDSTLFASIEGDHYEGYKKINFPFRRDK